MKRYPTCLTIAGSDSGGGAGIQADLKTMSALGVYGMSAITAITVQNTLGVRAVYPIPAEIVGEQIEAVMEDIGADAIKIGMLHNTACVQRVVEAIDRFKPAHCVLDPVMISTSGHRMIEEEAIALIRSALFRRITLLTPNTDEVEFLTGIAIRRLDDMYRAGEALLSAGCRAVLMKGGHLRMQQMTDILIQRDTAPLLFTDSYVETGNTHGTGCTLSSAIASYLALGAELPDAVATAKQYITQAIAAGAEVTTGGGHGPVNHFVDPKPLTPH